MSMYQALLECFPPATAYSVESIPNLTGKVVAITGGYGGIGYHTVVALLKKGATVYILGRSQQKYDAALQQLEADNYTVSASDASLSKRVHFIECDLGSLKSVHRASAELLHQTSVIHMLFCSAGVMLSPSGSQTADGYEMQFGTNVLGHWVLTKALLPALEQAGNETDQKARVVFTSSVGHRSAPPGCIDYTSLTPNEAGVVGGGRYKMTLYGQSKIGNIIIANEFQKRHGDKIVFSSCHPGNLKTDLGREVKGVYSSGVVAQIIATIENMVCYPAPLGALTQLYAATAPEAANGGGSYYVPWARLGTARADAQDPRVGAKLWEWLETETRAL